MFTSRIKTEEKDDRFSATDSFVVDLRARAFSPIAKTNKPAITQSPKNKKIKEPLPFRAHPNFLTFKRKREKFSWRHFWSRFNFSRSFFSHRYFFIFRTRPVLEFSLHRHQRRHFARLVSLRLRHLRPLRLKAEHTPSAEYLVSWYRSVFAFMVALIFIILPFKLLAYFKFLDISSLKADVITRAFSAFDNLAAASDNAVQLDLESAGSNFARASVDFSAAQAELSRVDDWLLAFASFSGNPKIRIAASSKQFLAAGVAGAEMGQHLSAMGSVFLEQPEDKSWGKIIDAFVFHGGLALDSARELQRNLQAIEAEDLPLEYRERFLSFRDQAELAVKSLDSLLGSAQEIKEFLGVSQDKCYLLVFQNNAEMRGAGGFFGSYALVDIRDGKIRRLEVPAGGSYDTEAGMRSFIQAPKPLWLVSARWYFWDANWWPDWPTSARSLMWFYEKSDGPTVDGVISFTPNVLEDLLRITGPIDMQAEYGLTVDADNFWELIQTTVEKENLRKTHPEALALIPDSPKNQPKKIIGDLMAEIMERLPQVLTAENAPALLSSLEKNLSAKNIMLYFNDPALQAKISRYGFDGAIAPAKQDYLLVAHTNIAGQKSDRRMEERIEHSAQVLSDGSVIDTVTIYRGHTGVKNEILSGVRNVDWLRVYVPKGSQLLAASGFSAPEASYFDEPEASWEVFPLLAETENRALTDLDSGTKIYTESDKTVFANWVMVDPGETAVIRLRYRLPFKIKKSEPTSDDWWLRLEKIFRQESPERAPFSLLVQKQPGAHPADLVFNLELPPTWQAVWNYPQTESWNSKDILDRDLLRAVLLEK